MENIDSVNNITSKVKGIEFRCPQCFKLYCVKPSEIHSAQPQFECQSCHANFVFDYPPKNKNALYTRLVGTRTLTLPQVGKLAKSDVQNSRRNAPELKACPKCQTMNPRGVSDCFKCGVVLAKAEAIQHEPKLSTFPSLMKMWQDLLHDYNNLTKHMAFVDRCEELQALPFALKKYKELKEVQPQDSLASQMMNSVLMKSLSRQAGQVVEYRALRFLKEIPYANIMRILPVMLGMGLLLRGLFSHGSRNYAGGGVALLVLILGYSYFAKGRLSWRDFWKQV